ncbi:MAG: iron-sulfur cluster assembly protein [Puniceicoccales bacterium]|jgi:probable FeS assembly SUF system protein SufT|nr:iron-sulfur cluster assembly protein [Puniceicoccales bacterium]
MSNLPENTNTPPAASSAVSTGSAANAAAATAAGGGVNNDRVLAREVAATVIPSGETTRLAAGTTVNITNRLGGNFTVVCDFGMFRIAGTDADALGEEVPDAQSAGGAGLTDAYGSRGTTDHPGHSGPPDEEALWEELRTVFDPEIPVNIVDLGLVYSLKVAPVPEAPERNRVEVAMTLTAPGCGMGPVIAEDARNRLLTVPGAHEAVVNIVWEPPWTTSMISEQGRMELGLV